jgi:hypothetical protein
VCVVYWYSIQQPLNRSGYASQSRVVCTMYVCLCVNVCICVLKSRGISFPGRICPCPLWHFAFSLRHALRHALGTTPALTGPSAPPLRFLPSSPLDTPGAGPPCGHLPSFDQRPLLTRGDGDGGQRGRQEELPAFPSDCRLHLLHLDLHYIHLT